MVRKFNPDRIITHQLNPSGNPMVMYDPLTGFYFPMGFVVVTDNNGNVVVT